MRLATLQALAAALLFLCLTSLLARADEPAKLTDEQRQTLTAEAKRQWEDAQRLDQEGKVKEAMAAGEKTLAADRRLLGDNHEDIAIKLAWLAGRYEQLEDFAAVNSAAMSNNTA